MIICKRIFADKTSNNGYRVLVDRIYGQEVLKRKLFAMMNGIKMLLSRMI
ncbi:MAG: hypothetical protein ACL7BU_10685 [Candidatus Phlomobacter fragariae]